MILCNCEPVDEQAETDMHRRLCVIRGENKERKQKGHTVLIHDK